MVIVDALLHKMPLIHAGGNHGHAVNFQCGHSLCMGGVRPLKPYLKRSAVWPFSHAEHISAQVDDRAFHSLIFQVCLHLVRYKALGYGSQVNGCLVIEEGDLPAIQDYIFISHLFQIRLNLFPGRHMGRLARKIPQGAQRLYGYIKGPPGHAAVLQPLRQYLGCFLRYGDGPLTRPAVVQFINLAALQGLAEQLLIVGTQCHGIKWTKELAETLSKYQDKNGLWYQVIDQPSRTGNFPEASVTAQCMYAYMKAVNKGYIDSQYRAIAEKAFKGLCNKLLISNSDGTLTLTRCCQVGGLGGKPYRDGSFEYYIGEKMRDNDAKATGPFIMGCIELNK